MENHHTNGTNGDDPSLIQYESSLYKFKGNEYVYIYIIDHVFLKNRY